MAKRLARLLPGYHFDEQEFFKCDNAPFDIQNLRCQAFFKLSEVLKARHPSSIQATAAARARSRPRYPEYLHAELTTD
jgi:glutamate-1-semialdehyde 2,1-aminomutase